MTNRSLIVVRFVVPLGLMLLTGCTTALSDTLTGKEVVPNTSPASEKTTEINNDSSVQSSQSPVATPKPTPSPTAKSRPQLTLASIHMMTTTTGWAEGWTLNRSITGIFRTSDGGLQWQDVSPPQAPVNSITLTYFLDELNAWLVVSPFGDPTTVTTYHTADGGQTWQRGNPFSIQKGALALLGFLDPQYGWLMVNLSEKQTGTEAVEIFETDDAGLHWTRVSLTSSQPDQSTPGSLPLACDKLGLAFSDISNGWVTGYCPGQAPLFYVTHDEGHIWQKVTLPDPQDPTKLLTSCDCEPGRPVFSSAQNGFFVLRGNFNSDRNAFCTLRQMAEKRGSLVRCRSVIPWASLTLRAPTMAGCGLPSRLRLVHLCHRMALSIGRVTVAGVGSGSTPTAPCSQYSNRTTTWPMSIL